MRDSLEMEIVELQKKTVLVNISTSSGKLSGGDVVEKLDVENDLFATGLGYGCLDYVYRISRNCLDKSFYLCPLSFHSLLLVLNLFHFPLAFFSV